MPTGGRGVDETLEGAPRRELADEGGYAAGGLELLTRYHTSKSILDETAYLYVAEDLSSATEHGDATELFRRQVWAFDEVVSIVHRADITDSMTVIAVLMADSRRRS
jgi:ADP-ribose pyrophosphatase